MINDVGKIDEVWNKIIEVIIFLGVCVISELMVFRNVNWVFLVGGGVFFIEEVIC